MTKAATATVLQGRAQKPEAHEVSSAIPELEVTVVMRRGSEIVASERFSVPFLPTPETAKDFARSLGAHYSKAVNRVIDAWKKT